MTYMVCTLAVIRLLEQQTSCLSMLDPLETLRPMVPGINRELKEHCSGLEKGQSDNVAHWYWASVCSEHKMPSFHNHQARVKQWGLSNRMIQAIQVDHTCWTRRRWGYATDSVDSRQPSCGLNSPSCSSYSGNSGDSKDSWQPSEE